MQKKLAAGIIVFVMGLIITVQADDFVFSDIFDSGSAWGMNEQIVNSLCYVADVGEVALSEAFVPSGTKCLSVFSNKVGIAKSNHVIANYKLFNNGITDSCAYSVSAYIDTTFDSGQTGPEFSVQNTRLVQVQYRTYTAGIQYVPNPWIRNGQGWSVWNSGNWMNFLDLKLENGKWYQFTLAVDFISNHYISLSIKGPTVDTTVNLGGYAISGNEIGFSEEALWLTAEAENLETACSGAPRVTQYQVFYDNVIFQILTPVNVHNLQNVKGNHDKILKVKTEFYNLLGQRVYPFGIGQNLGQRVLISQRENTEVVKYILWNKIVQ